MFVVGVGLAVLGVMLFIIGLTTMIGASMLASAMIIGKYATAKANYNTAAMWSGVVLTVLGAVLIAMAH